MRWDAGKIAVVALGGNAITREFEEGDIYQQFANTRRSLVGVAELIELGYRLAITHGNGPQIGNALIRVEATRDLLPPIPLGVLVADLEGGMGYMIEQSLQNKLHMRGIERPVVTLLAQVIVDKNDPSILHPTKFVGPFYTKEEIVSLETTRNYTLKEDSGRGYRRVVPSPIPRAIVEIATIKTLVHAGTLVITTGGGGIPVYIEEDGRYEGLDAVVDKDYTSAILAAGIRADELYILTSVEKVALNYRKKNMTYLDRMSKEEAQTYLEEGHFPPGNMGPKIEAAIHFLESGGKKAIITSIDKMSNAIRGETGTEIVP